MDKIPQAESVLLLSIYGQPEIQLKFKNQKKSHNTIWKEMSSQLTTLSDGKYTRSEQQCRDRLDNLKKKYFVLKREMRSGDSPPAWVFWDDMNSIFGPRPTATPRYMLDSFNENSSSLDTNQETSPMEEDSTDNPDFSIPSTSSQRTPGLKRCQPNPNSFRRTKKRLVEPATGMLQYLERMKKKEEAFMLKSEERDGAFLKVLGNISDSIKKIADGRNVGSVNDGARPTQSESGEIEDEYEYFYLNE